MTKNDAQTQMTILLGADVIGLLSPADIDWCLDRSRQESDFDGWIAAAEAAGLLAGRTARGQIVEWDSDGQRVKRTKAEWLEWADRWRAESPRSGGASVDFAFLVV